MKVKCINNEGVEIYITIDNEYTVMMKSTTLYEILNDSNVRMFMGVERFEVIEN